MPQSPPGRSPYRRWIVFVGVPLLIVLGVVLFWRWDWFIPLVEARAAEALGRPVTLAHLHVSPGRVTVVRADDVRIPNPPSFGDAPPLAQIAHLTIQVDVMRYIRDRTIAIPLIDIDQPRISATARPDGANNYTFDFGRVTSPQTAPEIGSVTIEDGQAHVVAPALKTDATLEMSTRNGDEPALVVSAKGTYAGQPVTGKLVSGSVLALRDASRPFPIDLHLANGATRVDLTGTVNDPMHFAGTSLKLTFVGADMADLYPLTGIPIPKTPGYKLTGQLTYADRKLVMTNMQGVVGDSDLEGTIAIDPGRERKDVTADVHSRRVDLADLRGFIGSQPGRPGSANLTPEQRQALARMGASPKLLPDTPINVPKLHLVDVHLKYRGDHIQGRSVPFDTLAADMDLVNGRISLHPVTLGVGTGRITGTIDLDPVTDNALHTKAEIQFQRVDLSRLMAATHVFAGEGRIGGKASIDTSGNSVSTMLGRGNGGLDLYMSGGNLSALLVDLSGLQFGKALFSALGLPERTEVLCLIGLFNLQRGVMTTRTLLLDTSEAVISGTGTIDFGAEKLNYELKTEPKHFTIGSLPAPISITGTFKNPSTGPDVAKLGVRGGAAVGLGLLAAPLALLPTIQFGVGDDNRCGALLSRGPT
jgi:AsmA family protein